MNINDELDILDLCFQFAYGNSRSRHDGDEKIARVVYFDKLVEHLFERDQDLYWEMLQEHGNLLNYLMNSGRYNVRTFPNRNWSAWNYEIMSINRYNNDLRHFHSYFNLLHTPRHELDSDLVFVTFRKQDKIAYDAERSAIKKKSALSQKQTEESDDLINTYQVRNIKKMTFTTILTIV